MLTHFFCWLSPILLVANPNIHPLATLNRIAYPRSRWFVYHHVSCWKITYFQTHVSDQLFLAPGAVNYSWCWDAKLAKEEKLLNLLGTDLAGRWIRMVEGGDEPAIAIQESYGTLAFNRQRYGIVVKTKLVSWTAQFCELSCLKRVYDVCTSQNQPAAKCHR